MAEEVREPHENAEEAHRDPGRDVSLAATTISAPHVIPSAARNLALIRDGAGPEVGKWIAGPRNRARFLAALGMTISRGGYTATR